ncbi:hypothetical protein QKT49_gp295 [Acanthamoeba castellanii medusavirus]|uniref:Uncharacterized protein n=1 Tax=Acanthamoeba castellanii medusavirus J1 TaxID=3114988 RepID=A0A3T1CXB1_9VIRU|nr:hypothetical protein QKT49_gp295 [Acanthamoeba castellanii medusavirus]BBI30468.1 hypothetical protein [Acanthamoeba castellanii medusavirus J1]
MDAQAHNGSFQMSTTTTTATPLQISDLEYRLSRLRHNCRRISENSGKMLDRFHQLLFPDPLSSLATLAMVQQSGRRASLPDTTTTTTTTHPIFLSLIEATNTEKEEEDYVRVAGSSDSPRRKRTHAERRRSEEDSNEDGDDSEYDPDGRQPPAKRQRRRRSSSQSSGSACATHQRMHKKCNNDHECVVDAMRNRARTS